MSDCAEKLMLGPSSTRRPMLLDGWAISLLLMQRTAEARDGTRRRVKWYVG